MNTTLRARAAIARWLLAAAPCATANSALVAPGPKPQPQRNMAPSWDKPSVTVFYNADEESWSYNVGERLSAELERRLEGRGETAYNVYMRRWGSYFDNGSSFLSCLTDVLPSLDAAAVILGPDDALAISPPTNATVSGAAGAPRSNVVLELGASVAALGADHTVLATRIDHAVKLPSYLDGIKHMPLPVDVPDTQIVVLAELLAKRAQEAKTVIPRPAQALFMGYRLNYMKHVVEAQFVAGGSPKAGEAPVFVVVLPFLDAGGVWENDEAESLTRALIKKNEWVEVKHKPDGSPRESSVYVRIADLPSEEQAKLDAAKAAGRYHVPIMETLPRTVYNYPTTLNVVFALARDRFSQRPKAHQLYLGREVSTFDRLLGEYSSSIGGAVGVLYARKDGALVRKDGTPAPVQLLATLAGAADTVCDAASSKLHG